MLEASISALTFAPLGLARSSWIVPESLPNRPCTLLTRWWIEKLTEEWAASILNVSSAAAGSDRAAIASGAIQRDGRVPSMSGISLNRPGNGRLDAIARGPGGSARDGSLV